MIAICPAAPSGAAFVRRILDFVDCQAQAIGAGGYQALSSPGSTLSLMLTGLLTLFVALIGYRMLFGQTPTVRDGVLALVKIGIVLALATSWSAYRTLIYDVAMHGPAELAGDVGRPAALPGSAGGLVDRLANADRMFELLAIEGTGRMTAPAAQPGRPGGLPTTTPGATPEMFPGFDSWALGWSRIAYLTGALGSLALVRLLAGLLLALGPFFIAFVLFDGTRGLFEGWLRVLAGAALGAAGLAVVLGVELALLEPWLAELLARRYAQMPIPGAAAELFVATLLIAVVLIGVLYGAARVAMGFRMAAFWRLVPTQVLGELKALQPQIAGLSQGAREYQAEGRARAAAIVDAVNAAQRREAGTPAAAFAAPGGPGEPGRRIHPRGRPQDLATPAATPLGQSFRRRTTTRVSARAGRRDIVR
ncbi:MAG TPA: type IV secretion system protein [Allosphingosinicella sp.]|nr:type IV secretion system protein [Allosphingosinicella sp.]